MPGPTSYAIPIHDQRLDNGLRVLVSEDPTVPVVAVNLWYDVGSRHEQPGRTGLAHLFEHLMFEGSEHAPKGTHFGLVQAAGGTLNATTWCDRTNYFETLPSHHLELALWLEADRMGGLLSSLSQETLDNQRDVVKNERRQRYENQPYGMWMEILHRLVWPEGHPYHHSTIGSMADLDAASLEDVRDFYRTYYAPNNAVLSIVGDVTVDAALPLVERYFGAIPAKDGIPPRPRPGGEVRIGTQHRHREVDQVPLPRSFFAFRCPPFGEPGHEVATLLAAVLGGGRGSRLYRELVLERRLAQPPDGGMLDTWDFTGGTAVMVGDVVAREGVDIDAVEDAYLEVTGSVARDGVSEDELARAKALLTSHWLARMSSLDGRADTLSQYATLFGDPQLVNTQLARLHAVEVDAVRALADELLRDDNRVIITFVPEAEEAAA